MSTIITPIIIPQPAPQQCPNCKREEDTVIVCRHCRYEYPEKESGGFLIGLLAVALVVTTAILIIWILLVFIRWWDGDGPLFSLIAQDVAGFFRTLFSRKLW